MDWSGLYVGGNIGGTWGRTNVQIPLIPSNFNISSSSFSGGGQIGANWQTSDWLLLGIEGDISAMNLAGSHLSGGPPGERFAVRYDLRYSARGRLALSTTTRSSMSPADGSAPTSPARTSYRLPQAFAPPT